MSPAAQCETHNFVVKTPRANEATAEELQKMTEKLTNHTYSKGVQSGLNSASYVIGGEKPNNQPCKITYHEVTPPDL